MSYMRIEEDDKKYDKKYSSFEIERGSSNPLLRVSTSLRNNHDIMFSPVKPTQRKWPFQFKSTDHKPISRVIDRGGDFHQSSGAISIRKRIHREDWRALYIADWFHSVVDAPTWRIIVMVVIVYILMVAFFALCYYLISCKYGCNLEIRTYTDAVGFSLQTMATIGYDTKDVFFGDCWIALTTLCCQILAGIFSDAIILGIIFCRLSRPHARASTVLFSNKGIIRRIRGKLYFMFQLCELRKHQLSEAHVRLYVIKNEVDPTENGDVEAPPSVVYDEGKPSRTSTSDSLYQKVNSHVDDSPLPDKRQKFIKTCSMRLNHPNDAIGGMLLLMVPQLVVHEIDEYSPLMPPPVWFPNNGSVAVDGAIRWNPPVYEHLRGTKYESSTEFPNVMGRSVDEVHAPPSNSSLFSGSTSVHQTPVKSHVHDSSRHHHFPLQTTQDEEKAMVQHYMEDRQIEIIAIVEGSAATSGGQVQARHSFLSSDIEWDKCFAHCMYKDPDDGCTTIDFSLYHELVACSKDASSAGPIASAI